MAEDRLSVQDELEMRVLASMLAEPDWIGEAVTGLRADDFQEESCGDVFAALHKLFLDGRPVTPMAVTLEAGDWSKDLITELHRQPLAALTREEFKGLCESLQTRSRFRKVKLLAFRLTTAEEPELAAHLADEINGAMAGRQSARAVTLGQAAVDFVSNLDAKPRYLTWGIKLLDEELFVEAGDFVVLGGYASSGKTLLALQMALGLAETYRVGFFSLETSAAKLFARIAAHRSRVSLRQIKRRSLIDYEHDALTRALTELDKLDLTLIQAGGSTVTDIQAMTLQHRFQVIFVDYLQLVGAGGRDRYEQVTAVSIGLHTLAQRHGVTVVALAQLSRPEKTKTKDGKPVPPSMSSFRESGQIEQDADVAMLLYPAEPNNNRSNRILKVSKNKEGEKLSLELAFDGATQTLTPIDPEKKAMQKIAGEGRKLKQQKHAGQETIAGFTETDEEVPWDGSEFG
ncbi:MAG: AAA family ATPase [Clostridia bacterium]|nr:AAA family ATPase [Clostridia bacterium]